jgi:pimeloyl-ACP methyl ester carboxylesterase
MKSMLLSFFLVANLISFSQNEKEVENVQGICTLKGTLSSPEGGFESTDLIILVAGSGPTDRNGNNAQMTNNSLKMISDDLVNTYGYCVLRYDKRSIAGSKIENFAQKNLSFDDFISDASSWVDKYKDNGLYKNIILAGHSQGSLVAIAAANKNKNVDAVISLAGAGRPIHSILKKQLSASLTIEMQGLVNAKLDTLASGQMLKDTPKLLHSLMHPSIQPFLISWMKYDPAVEIAKLKIPVLLINGTTDIQVDVSEMDLLLEALPTATRVKIKNMNHVLKTIKTKDMGLQLELYGKPDVPLSKKLIKTMAKFLGTLPN